MSSPMDRKREQREAAHPVDPASGPLTTDQGVAVDHTDDSLTVGERGPTLMEDFHFAGGLPGFLSRIPDLLHLDRPTVCHDTLREQIAGAQVHDDDVIRTRDNPVADEGGVADLPLRQIFGIGAAQCLSMIPGVSRSGATIMGALAMGVGRKTAAEFSFFLAVPTMIGASTLELIDNGTQLGAGGVGWSEIAIGFVVSFVVALVVIRGFVAYVSRHGFAPFAWYRIALGIVVLWALR